MAGDKRAVEIAIAAAAEGGKANTAIIAFLAEAIGLRKSDLDIKTGAGGRVKIIEIRGDAALLYAKIDTWLARLR